MAELEKKLSASFLRIHRSFMVNLNHVRKLESWFGGGYRLELNNGAELDVRQKKSRGFEGEIGNTMNA